MLKEKHKKTELFWLYTLLFFDKHIRKWQIFNMSNLRGGGWESVALRDAWLIFCEQMFNNTKVKEEHLSVWQNPLCPAINWMGDVWHRLWVKPAHWEKVKHSLKAPSLIHTNTWMQPPTHPMNIICATLRCAPENQRLQHQRRTLIRAWPREIPFFYALTSYKMAEVRGFLIIFLKQPLKCKQPTQVIHVKYSGWNNQWSEIHSLWKSWNWNIFFV